MDGKERMAPGTEHERALEGVRVLDLTWVVAGPTATRMLAAWGAEVLKVEWPGRPDPIRFETPPPPDLGPVPAHFWAEVSGFFNDTNANKKSVTLNMRSTRGQEIFERLLTKCDVLCENFSPAVMESWVRHWQTRIPDSALAPRQFLLRAE